jgi:hypothetical protein
MSNFLFSLICLVFHMGHLLKILQNNSILMFFSSRKGIHTHKDDGPMLQNFSGFSANFETCLKHDEMLQQGKLNW